MSTFVRSLGTTECYVCTRVGLRVRMRLRNMNLLHVRIRIRIRLRSVPPLPNKGGTRVPKKENSIPEKDPSQP